MSELLHRFGESYPTITLLTIGTAMHKKISYLLFVALFTSSVGVLSAVVRDRSPFHVDTKAVKGAWIDGLNVTIHVVAHRDYPSCSGGYINRHLVTYRDAAHTQINRIMDLREQEIPDPDAIDVDLWPTYHLLSPLPSAASNWFYINDIHYNCPWWYKLLPSTIVRYFMTDDIKPTVYQASNDAPPIPVTP